MSVVEKILVKEVLKMVEFYDLFDIVVNEVLRIVDFINRVKYCVVFMGVGIFIVVGIGDYWGKLGKWIEEDR